MLRSRLGLPLVALAFFLVAYLVTQLRLTPPALRYGLTANMRVGWIDAFPYQFENRRNGVMQHDGLGYKVLEIGLQQAGFHPTFRDGSWDEQLAALQRGELDAVMMAYPTPERESYAYFSDPYLQMNASAFYRLDLVDHVPSNPSALTEFCQRRRLRVAALRDAAYPEPLQTLVSQARSEGRLVENSEDSANLEALIDGAADLTLTDQGLGEQQIRQQSWGDAIGTQAWTRLQQGRPRAA